MRTGLSLDVDALGVDSFVPVEPTEPETAFESRLYYTVYFYYETDQMSCGDTCGCHWA